MITRIRWATSVSALLVAGLFIASGRAHAKDYPPSPIDPKVVALSPTSIDFVLHLPPSCGLDSRFEIEETINGVRQSASQETSLSKSYRITTDTAARYSSGGRDCSVPYDFPLGGLTPETEYCFRAWTRTIDSGVRSLFASVWACAHTPPYPPLAPLDVRAIVVSRLADAPPHISWTTPDQSNHRGIASYVVERQSPPGPNRPWIFEQEVAGPAGAQSASTRLAFSIVGSTVNLGAKHVYRVCSVNDAARNCAEPVEIATAPDAFGVNAAQGNPAVVLPSTPTPVAKARNEPGPNRMPSDSGQRVATASSMPIATPAAMAVTNQGNRYAAPMEIMEPAPGSALTQGNVRVRVRPPTGVAATPMAEVELSWLAPRINKPGESAPVPPAVKVKTWQVPLDRLAQGVVLPRDVTNAWIGPTLVRVRMAGAGESAWSNGVSFDLVSVAGRQATTPSTAPNWMTTTPAPPTKATQLDRMNPVGPAAATGAPASSLQPRP